MPTVAETLHRAVLRLRAVPIDDARIEAEVLLAHALGCDRAHLYAALGDEVAGAARGAFDAAMARRFAREPLAYIIGAREFYGLDIACGSGALIPRPETEMLVAYAVERLGDRASPIAIADVGTGTGAIAVAVAVHLPQAHVIATDTSPDALAVAGRNTARHGVAGRVHLQAADLLDGQGAFDLVLANLPYVAESEWQRLQPEVRDHEPKAALVPGARGTEAIARLIDELPTHLSPRAAFAAEIGATEADELLAIARRVFPLAVACVRKDAAGLDRMLVIET